MSYEYGNFGMLTPAESKFINCLSEQPWYTLNVDRAMQAGTPLGLLQGYNPCHHHHFNHVQHDTYNWANGGSHKKTKGNFWAGVAAATTAVAAGALLLRKKPKKAFTFIKNIFNKNTANLNKAASNVTETLSTASHKSWGHHADDLGKAANKTKKTITETVDDAFKMPNKEEWLAGVHGGNPQDYIKQADEVVETVVNSTKKTAAETVAQPAKKTGFLGKLKGFIPRRKTVQETQKAIAKKAELTKALADKLGIKYTDDLLTTKKFQDMVAKKAKGAIPKAPKAAAKKSATKAIEDKSITKYFDYLKNQLSELKDKLSFKKYLIGLKNKFSKKAANVAKTTGKNTDEAVKALPNNRQVVVSNGNDVVEFAGKKVNETTKALVPSNGNNVAKAVSQNADEAVAANNLQITNKGVKEFVKNPIKYIIGIRNQKIAAKAETIKVLAEKLGIEYTDDLIATRSFQKMVEQKAKGAIPRAAKKQADTLQLSYKGTKNIATTETAKTASTGQAKIQGAKAKITTQIDETVESIKPATNKHIKDADEKLKAVDEAINKHLKSGKPPANGDEAIAVLGIKRSTPYNKAKKAYHKLAFKFHTDKNPNQANNDKFNIVKEAWDYFTKYIANQ